VVNIHPSFIYAGTMSVAVVRQEKEYFHVLADDEQELLERVPFFINYRLNFQVRRYHGINNLGLGVIREAVYNLNYGKSPALKRFVRSIYRFFGGNPDLENILSTPLPPEKTRTISS